MTPPPLQGIRVIDLTRLLPGSFCTTLLARLGAEIIKIEPPGNDDPLLAIERRMGGGGEFTRSLYRGKLRVAIDLDLAAGREILLQLVESADVLVESYRPGAAERLNLDRNTLAAQNPRLIHCSLTACGVDGKLATRGGHDLNLLAMAGVLSLLKPVDGPPPVPGIQIGGLGASSLPAVQAVLAALFARERDGNGRHITISMVHNLQSWMGLERSVTRGSRAAGQAPTSMLRGGLPCYNVYETADGRYVALGGAQPRLWREFCAAVERPGWVDRQYDPELIDAVRALMAQRSFAAWQAYARDRDLCIEPVLEVDEAEELLRDAGPAASGLELLPGVWFSGFDDLAPATTEGTAAAPATGAHTRQVLCGLGLDDDRLTSLAGDGVIAAAAD